MFGKKKKLAQLEAERQQQEALKQQEVLQTPPPQEPAEEEKLFVQSETIEDDDSLPEEYESIAYILKQELGEDLVAIPVEDESDDEIEDVELEEITEIKEESVEETVEEQEETAQEIDEIEETEEVEDSEEEVVEDEQEIEYEEESEEAQDGEDEVVYVVDGPSEDDDEIVKPAKLVKLPNLVDYMLSQNMSKKMKINIATLLLSAYGKYKDIPAEKKIVVQCMAKVMSSLVQDSHN